MNKTELIKAVAENCEITQVCAQNALNCTLRLIANSLAKGESVEIPGFGQWLTIDTPERTGRNPKTGDAITIPAHKSLRFKAGKQLRDAANGTVD